ncbi:hypothetical protein N7535_002983 [Penicillium sp. DV-2018c]|nr:hypothetical protein N7461_001331 [Penicillium sp. DV-2018c]KAJ5576057.1 hypothetical protein N7535_002983 [Penicillium sp. DV-2018c]
MDNLSLPTDDGLPEAPQVLSEIRSENPDLGHAKIIDRFSNEHQCRISEIRPKKPPRETCTLTIKPGPRVLKETELSPLTLPRNALAMQQRYRVQG